MEKESKQEVKRKEQIGRERKKIRKR